MYWATVCPTSAIVDFRCRDQRTIFPGPAPTVNANPGRSVPHRVLDRLGPARLTDQQPLRSHREDRAVLRRRALVAAVRLPAHVRDEERRHALLPLRRGAAPVGVVEEVSRLVLADPD